MSWSISRTQKREKSQYNIDDIFTRSNRNISNSDKEYYLEFNCKKDFQELIINLLRTKEYSTETLTKKLLITKEYLLEHFLNPLEIIIPTLKNQLKRTNNLFIENDMFISDLIEELEHNKENYNNLLNSIENKVKSLSNDSVENNQIKIKNNSSSKKIKGNYQIGVKNEVLEEIPEFNKVTREIYQKLEENGKHLLRAIATYLELPVNYFDEHVHNGNSILRGIHYFPIENPDELPDDAVRAGAHEDINLITLLIGASADGLEVLTQQGEWFAITAQGEDIVVNVGDMLQRLTNNKLRSTTHRVVNPPREMMKNSRYSVPFFLHPKSNMDLTCLDLCIDADHPKAYNDITAGEYLDERLREIGLKM